MHKNNSDNYDRMPSDGDQDDGLDRYVDRGGFKVPRHLVGLYDEGRIGADALCAVGGLFDNVGDYERVKASGEGRGDVVDPRYFEAATRLIDLSVDPSQA